MGKLLDYRRYLLYNNQRKSQPGLKFPLIEKPLTETKAQEVKCDVKVPLARTSFDTTLVKTNVPSSSTSNAAEISGVTKTALDETNIPSTSTNSDTQSRGVTKTASDPKFLQEFYNNSRLHLISTLGAEYKQLVNQMRENADGSFPGKEKLIAALGSTMNKKSFI